MDTPGASHASRLIVIGGLVVVTASLAVLAVGRPEGVTPSRDPGAPTVPLLVVVGPALVGIAVALVLSRRRPRPGVRIVRRGRLLVTTGLLTASAVAFPIVTATSGWDGEDYVLGKALLLILLPLVVVTAVRKSVAIQQPRAAWRWWAPLSVVVVWSVLRGLGGSSPDYSAADPASLMIAATATAITAGFGEELFYRRLLQTRLEALLGPWAGVTLASSAFALMHLGSHSTGEGLFDLASVVVVQGSFGLLMGVLWMRYRNLTAIVVAHVLANGWHEIALHVLLRST